MPQTVAAQTFADFRDKLAGFIRKRVSRSEDAEDILQECFYQFTRVNELCKPVEQTAAWLYRVARNLIINRYKKSRKSLYRRGMTMMMTIQISWMKLPTWLLAGKRRRKQSICAVLF
jgi:RNA polymerase sigma factor (sigma-70 family)